ncbi:MAG: VOC family protein [Myxococcales bacterium]|nr:VOC family protein [Myxococcales bacterium]
MIDHLTLSVTDLPKAVAFYEKALAPLGYSLVMAFEQYRAFGPKGKPTLWLKHAEVPTTPMHLAFVAKDRKAVDAFHRAASAAGARDSGAPGLRPHYHQNYYGAFVTDPMGHPIEAVCHHAPNRKRAPAGKKAPARARKAKR